MNARQHDIAAAATRLFLTEGVGVSTARIAKAAGVSNGTLFNAFATKQDLIDAIFWLAKTEMFASMPHSGAATFDRQHLHDNWDGYIAWARAKPETCKIMHFLLDSGLASQATQDAIDAIAAPYVNWLQGALDQGLIRGPGVSFIGKLIFFYTDLVIIENLQQADSELAFDMLCNAIGLKHD